MVVMAGSGRDAPTFIAPMLAGAGPSGVHRGGAEWAYERKLDGLRCIAVRDGARVELWSRNHKPFTGRFPGIVGALAALAADRFVLDGEIVAYDGERTSFALLAVATARPVLGAFDLLHLLGADITSLALTERKQLLGQLLEGVGPAVTSVGQVAGDPATLLAAACRAGWEGLIAKQADSPYRSGRSPAWRKLKCTASQELVIGGWTDPGGGRRG